MAIQALFKKYEEEITNYPQCKEIFEASGMVSTKGKLDFGFFPLGSGVLAADRDKSVIDKARMPAGGVMVFG